LQHPFAILAIERPLKLLAGVRYSIFRQNGGDGAERKKFILLRFSFLLFFRLPKKQRKVNSNLEEEESPQAGLLQVADCKVW
jgi:hypothetical protein